MKTILLAEDSPVIQKMAKQVIEARGYKVICAEDGVSALERAYETTPDAMIFDLVMPRLRGVQVARLLREHPPLKHIPIVMLTATTQPIHKYWALVSGVDGYFLKPGGGDEMEKTFDEILSFLEETIQPSSQGEDLPKIEDPLGHLGKMLYQELVVTSLKNNFASLITEEKNLEDLKIASLEFLSSLLGNHIYFVLVDNGTNITLTFLSPFLEGDPLFKKCRPIVEEYYFQIAQQGLPDHLQTNCKFSEKKIISRDVAHLHHYVAPLCFKICGAGLKGCPRLEGKIPEKCGRNSVGLLGVLSHEALLPEMALIMGVLSKTLAGAINDLIIRKEVESLAPLKAYVNLLQILNQAKTLEEVLDMGLKTLVSFAKSQVGIVFLLQEESGRFFPKATHGLAGSQLLNQSFVLGEGLVGQVAKTCQPLSLRGEGAGLLKIDTGVEKVSAQGLLFLPILFQNKILGVLALASVSPYSEERTQHIRSMTDQWAIAIHNAKKTKKLEENRGQNEFLAGVSHELRTPLNAVLGYTSLAIDDLQNSLLPKQLGYLTSSKKSAKTLLKMIGHILDFSKIEAGRREVYLEEVDLREVLDECQREVRQELAFEPEKKLELRWEVPPEVPLVESDYTMVQQIINNLLSNAAQFTKEGFVALGVRKKAGGLVVEVEDSGEGIQRKKAEIFEPFGNSTGSSNGAGLGLAITHRLCEMLGIGLDFQSQVGRGTIFSLFIPIKMRVQK